MRGQKFIEGAEAFLVRCEPFVRCPFNKAWVIVLYCQHGARFEADNRSVIPHNL